MADHVIDVLPRYHRIMEIGQTSIDRGLFLNGTEVRDVVDAMATETLQYRRQHMNRGSRVRVCHMW